MLYYKIVQIDENSIAINDELYIKEPCITVVEIRHLGQNKIFLFECVDEELKSELRPKQYVICETMRGECVGIVCSSQYIQPYEARLKGAYMPLKKVLRVATQEEIIKAYEAADNTTPF